MSKLYKTRSNAKGQFVKGVSILITKELQKIADDVAVRVKPIVRDELEKTYRLNVYETYAPISNSGKAVKEHNDSHTHKQSQPYHHTGIFVNSTKAVIDGSVVKMVIEDHMYPDGASTTQVYEWLTKGTTKTPVNDSYPYIKKSGGEYSTGWATYNPTPEHKFEQKTLAEMEIFLDNLIIDIKNNPTKYHGKYKNKVQAKFLDIK